VEIPDDEEAYIVLAFSDERFIARRGWRVTALRFVGRDKERLKPASWLQQMTFHRQ
jgi:hypothetical protein